MSELFTQGSGRALGEAVGGVIMAAFMSVVATMPLVQESWGWFFAFIAAIPLLGLLVEMRVWSIIYTAGWFFGIIIISGSGIIPLHELALYLGVPIVIWVVKGYVYFRDEGYI